MRRGEDADGAPERLGEEGDVCAQCGTPLQIDQRYCLNCGTPRTEPRLDYERHLAGGKGPGGAGPMGDRSNGVQWSPVLVVLAIAALGVMLLLGVLIGKDDGDLTVTEVPASTTTTTPTSTFPTEPTTPTTTPTETTPSTTTTPLPDGSSVNPDEQRDGAGGLSAPGGTD